MFLYFLFIKPSLALLSFSFTLSFSEFGEITMYYIQSSPLMVQDKVQESKTLARTFFNGAFFFIKSWTFHFYSIYKCLQLYENVAK